VNDNRPGRVAKLVATYPSLMLAAFFLVPFAIMIIVSFFERIEGAQSGYAPGFEFTHYARFFSPLFTNAVWVSIKFASIAALLSVVIAFPFTYFLSRFDRRAQVMTLVFILSVLSLSEVIVAYSWSILLSRTAGISNLFVFLGFMEKPTSWTPGYAAVMWGLTYFNLPFATLIMYPQCTRLDRELTEAAQTLGASPMRTFFSVVVPLLWPTILTAFIVLFVFTMGAYVTPQWLGRPEHWMFAILIGDQALVRGNIPFAAAMSMFFMIITLALVLCTVWLGRKKIDP
jgi:putative spermidine/putrescine transport system permease protein